MEGCGGKGRHRSTGPWVPLCHLLSALLHPQPEAEVGLEIGVPGVMPTLQENPRQQGTPCQGPFCLQAVSPRGP